MFDSIRITSPETKYVTKEVNIKEKKAPTDESIRLLNEFQEKALRNLLCQFKLENNNLNVNWFFYRDDFGYDHELACVIKLNGKTYEEHAPINTLNFSFSKGKMYEETEKSLRKIVENLFLKILAPEVFDFISRKYNA